MIRIVDHKNKICIWTFAKSGSQIIEKIFIKNLNLTGQWFGPHVNDKPRVLPDYSNWIMVRDHRKRVLSVYYEKQLHWHEHPDTVRIWGEPTTYENFIFKIFPKFSNDHHLLRYTAFPLVQETNFDKVFLSSDIDKLLLEYCSITNTDKSILHTLEQKIFHKVPYLDDKKNINIQEPWKLSAKEIKQQKLFFTHNIMNSENILKFLKQHYYKDFSKFQFLNWEGKK